MGRNERRIGDVEPFAILHEGPVTTIYKGYQASLDRVVLLKVLKLGRRDAQMMRRFEDEARLLAKISHPNVVAVYAYGREDERAYLITEYVDGRDVGTLVEEGPLPVERALRILLETARGLRAAHAKGILHRDIKPSNFLLANAGAVKLTDFGMASLSDAGGDRELRGTPAYMAPELYKGAAPSKASDLFALGAAFYAMLTGQQAFAGSSTEAVIDAVLHHDPLQVLDFHADVPVGMRAILSRLLAKDPKERYSRVGRLIDDLDAFNRQVLERPVPSEEPVTDWSAEKGIQRWWHFEYVALVVLLLMGSTLGWGLTEQARLEAATETDAAAVSYTPESAPPARRSMFIVQPDSIAPADLAQDDSAQSPPTLEEEEVDMAAVPTTGLLEVQSDPAAAIAVNGVPKGTTPLRAELDSGRHRIQLQAPHFPAYVREVNIRTDERAVLDVSLWETVGRLAVQVYPWAEVYIDDKSRDTTPLSEPLVIRPGEHMLSLRHPTYGAWDTTITVQAGSNASLEFNWLER